MNERWKEHFEHDIAFHRKTAAIYDHVNTEPRHPCERPPLRAIGPSRRSAASRCWTWAAGPARCCSATRRAFAALSASITVAKCSTSRKAACARRHWRAAGALVHSDFFQYLEQECRPSLARDLRRLPASPASRGVRCFFRLVRSRLRPGRAVAARGTGRHCRAAKRPPPMARWNARSVMAARAPLMPMEESHEAPIVPTCLLRQPEDFGFRRVVASRAWEMFQRSMPASAFDHLAMRYLAARCGDTGNRRRSAVAGGLAATAHQRQHRPGSRDLFTGPRLLLRSPSHLRQSWPCRRCPAVLGADGSASTRSMASTMAFAASA